MKPRVLLALLVCLGAILIDIGCSFDTIATGQLPQGISATTEARQTVWFSSVKPNTAYSAYFYAYHYPGDQHPYALGYSGLPSNASGTYKASVSLSDLAQQYEGGEGPVYSVKVCLLEASSFTEIACTPYTYVGYLPSSEWTYHG